MPISVNPHKSLVFVTPIVTGDSIFRPEAPSGAWRRENAHLYMKGAQWPHGLVALRLWIANLPMKQRSMVASGD